MVVDRDDALAAAHLLLQYVTQQAATHRAGVVCCEALALARHQRGNDVERIQLSVRVLQRGTCGMTLVDHHVHVGGSGMRRGALAARLHVQHVLGLPALVGQHPGPAALVDHAISSRGSAIRPATAEAATV